MVRMQAVSRIVGAVHAWTGFVPPRHVRITGTDKESSLVDSVFSLHCFLVSSTLFFFFSPFRGKHDKSARKVTEVQEWKKMGFMSPSHENRQNS